MKKQHLRRIVSIVLVIVTLSAVATFSASASREWNTFRTQSVNTYNDSNTRAIQYVLTYSRGAGLAIDGQFGTNTRNAVVTFQKDRGLTADGIVGQNTWTHLKYYIKAERVYAPYFYYVGTSVSLTNMYSDETRYRICDVPSWNEWYFNDSGSTAYNAQKLIQHS